MRGLTAPGVVLDVVLGGVQVGAPWRTSASAPGRTYSRGPRVSGLKRSTGVASTTSPWWSPASSYQTGPRPMSPGRSTGSGTDPRGRGPVGALRPRRSPRRRQRPRRPSLRRWCGGGSSAPRNARPRGRRWVASPSAMARLASVSRWSRFMSPTSSVGPGCCSARSPSSIPELAATLRGRGSSPCPGPCPRVAAISASDRSS